jgi:isopentenyl diphosphate isomerase/L-lactate dehydrogenase-like FMN-dependent dehydrogenase
VIVSNHGGRQLDQSPATLDVLEDIVETVDGRAEVYLDGGVRRGTDVVSALAIGARGVFVGRPYLYGLAVAGERGVARVLELLEIELENAMALLGAPAIEDITRDHVS